MLIIAQCGDTTARLKTLNQESLNIYYSYKYKKFQQRTKEGHEKYKHWSPVYKITRVNTIMKKIKLNGDQIETMNRSLGCVFPINASSRRAALSYRNIVKGLIQSWTIIFLVFNSVLISWITFVMITLHYIKIYYLIKEQKRRAI